MYTDNLCAGSTNLMVPVGHAPVGRGCTGRAREVTKTALHDLPCGDRGCPFRFLQVSTHGSRAECDPSGAQSVHRPDLYD